jgi:hypothetical protein
MNTGRNIPCPCGSGKKYKKCCGSRTNKTGVNRYDRIDPILFNKEIAYKGKIGGIREQFCKKYIQYRQHRTRIINEKLEYEMSEKGLAITCHEGCIYCCYQHITSSLKESEAIVYYLYRNDEALSNFTQNYPIWSERTRKHESLFDDIGRLHSEPSSMRPTDEWRKAVNGAAWEYLKLNIPCPFLMEGSCSIYEVRPWCCESVVATSPAEWCDGANEKEPKICMVNIDRTEEPPYFRDFDGYAFSNTPIGVYQILVSGTNWMSQIPGLENLHSAFISDPEVISAASNYSELQ